MPYSQQYDNLAWQVAREVFGDSELAQVFYRMMKQESGFDSDVVEGRRGSSAGAQGIAQFMPATAQEQGVDPLNPEEALRGGATYLQKLIAYFGGDVAKGVAAYNAGAGGVETAVQKSGANWVSALPGETQSYLQITQPGGETMPDGQVGPWKDQYGVEGGGAGVPENELVSFIISHFGLRGEEEGNTARDQAMDIIQQDPWKATALFQSMTGEGGDLERRATEAGILWDEANARRVVAELGGDTYEQGRQRILDKMDEEHWGEQQAISEFNAWMSAALEAGKRGETVYGEQMRRAAWTTPEEHYPGTEPGGARGRFAERYGVEYTPSPGVAVETLPNPEQMYSKWHQNMGISQQAPATAGGWSGQGGQQGQRWNAAQDFLQQMGLRQGAR